MSMSPINISTNDYKLLMTEAAKRSSGKEKTITLEESGLTVTIKPSSGLNKLKAFFGIQGGSFETVTITSKNAEATNSIQFGLSKHLIKNRNKEFTTKIKNTISVKDFEQPPVEQKGTLDDISTDTIKTALKNYSEALIAKGSLGKEQLENREQLENLIEQQEAWLEKAREQNGDLKDGTNSYFEKQGTPEVQAQIDQCQADLDKNKAELEKIKTSTEANIQKLESDFNTALSPLLEKLNEAAKVDAEEYTQLRSEIHQQAVEIRDSLIPPAPDRKNAKARAAWNSQTSTIMNTSAWQQMDQLCTITNELQSKFCSSSNHISEYFSVRLANSIDDLLKVQTSLPPNSPLRPTLENILKTNANNIQSSFKSIAEFNNRSQELHLEDFKDDEDVQSKFRDEAQQCMEFNASVQNRLQEYLETLETK